VTDDAPEPVFHVPERAQVDPFDYARELVERLRAYVDRRNEHRRAAIQMMQDAVADHERALTDKGWVALKLDEHERDISTLGRALSEDGWVKRSFDAQNRKLNAIFVTLFSTLVTLLVTLVSILFGALR
jgi:hypothetical protein